MEQIKRIDVHHHIIPDIYREALLQHGIGQSAGKSIDKWTPEASLNLMGGLGIQAGICSISEPALYPIVAKDKVAAKNCAQCK